MVDKQQQREVRIKRRKMVVIALVAAGLVIGGLHWWQRNAEQQGRLVRQRAAALAWANLQHCVFGAPLGTIASLPRRVRLIELAGGRSGDTDSWPTRCTVHGIELHDALDDHGPAGALKAQLGERLGGEKQWVIDEPAAQLEGLAALAKQAGLPPVAATVTGPPLLDRELLQKERIAPLSPWNATLVDSDQLEDGTVRLLFGSPARGLQLCELRPDDGGADCGTVPVQGASAGVKLQPGGTLAVLSRPAAGAPGRSTYRADTGAEVTLHGGLYRGMALIEIGDHEFELADVQDGQAKREAKLKLPMNSSTPWLMADHLAWLEPSGGLGHRLQLRKLTADGELLGDKQAVAAVPASREPSQVCRSGTAAVALFGTAQRPTALVFYDGQSWSSSVAVGAALVPVGAGSTTGSAPPASAGKGDGKPDVPVQRRHQEASEFGIIGLLGSAEPAPDGSASPWGKVPSKTSGLWGKPKDRPSTGRRARALKSGRSRPGLPTHSFTCGEGTATLTWREPRPGRDHIHQLHCTPTGCRRSEATILGLGVKVWWLATALGSRTLLVWRARGGELRIRLAPLAELAKTEDALIMDSADHGGPATVDLAAFVGRSAVVFLFRDVGYQGLRINGEGEVASLL